MSTEVERAIKLLKERRQDVVLTSVGGRIVVMDSLTFVDWRNNSGDVLVAASFCGAVSVAFAAGVNPRGLIACDGGIGKDEAGVSGLPVLDTHGIPGGAAATMSARLGDGHSLYEGGVLSRVNGRAYALGIRPGMAVREAARRMLEYRRDPPVVERRREVLYEGQRGRVVAMVSASFADESNRSDVICVGSHAGVTGAGYALWLRPRGVLANDGGGAKDNSGVASLPLFDHLGVPAAAVGTMSARIGDPRSLYDEGIISAANATARKLGIVVGMPARTAALRMLGEEKSA
jgi:uncharacterized protein YunC (DUF1805 family)